MTQSQDSGHAAAPVDGLHQQIMNLPCKYEAAWQTPAPSDWIEGYVNGHRDTRYAAAELVSRALAAPAPTQRPSHVHETWWLVESTFAPVPLYFAGPRKSGKGPDMVADVNRAIRFPDEDSATRTICLVLDIPVGGGFMLKHQGYAVREHIFDYTPRAALSGAAPTPQPELTDEDMAELFNIAMYGDRGNGRKMLKDLREAVHSLLVAAPTQAPRPTASLEPVVGPSGADWVAIGAVRFLRTGGNVGLAWSVEGNGTLPRDGETVYVKDATQAPQQPVAAGVEIPREDDESWRIEAIARALAGLDYFLMVKEDRAFIEGARDSLRAATGITSAAALAVRDAVLPSSDGGQSNG